MEEGNERKKFTKKYPYLRTSPQIFCDGENIGGFTDLIEENPDDLRWTTNQRRRKNNNSGCY